jgi:hypothetical protein
MSQASSTLVQPAVAFQEENGCAGYFNNPTDESGLFITTHWDRCSLRKCDTLFFLNGDSLSGFLLSPRRKCRIVRASRRTSARGEMETWSDVCWRSGFEKVAQSHTIPLAVQGSNRSLFLVHSDELLLENGSFTCRVFLPNSIRESLNQATIRSHARGTPMLSNSPCMQGIPL